MKCPKCGYNSFEFLDACKKCGTELSSFKKSHRISSIFFRMVGLSKEEPSPEVTPPSAQPSPEEPAVQADNDFTPQAFQEPASITEAKDPYADFDVEFVDSLPDECKEEELSGFSFSEEPVSGESAAPLSSPDISEGEFSFEESVDGEQVADALDFEFEESGPEMEGYELMLEPESIEAASGTSGETMSENSEEDKFSGTEDFFFSSESEAEDILGEQNESDPPPLAEKTAQPNLEDFDKEFELIFETEESENTGEKTT